MPVRLQAERNGVFARGFGRGNRIVDPQRKTEALLGIRDFPSDRNSRSPKVDPRIPNEKTVFLKIVARVDGAGSEGLSLAADKKHSIAHAERDFQPRLMSGHGTPGEDADTGLDVQPLMKIAFRIEFFQKRTDVETVDARVETVYHTA